MVFPELTTSRKPNGSKARRIPRLYFLGEREIEPASPLNFFYVMYTQMNRTTLECFSQKRVYTTRRQFFQDCATALLLPRTALVATFTALWKAGKEWQTINYYVFYELKYL